MVSDPNPSRPFGVVMSAYLLSVIGDRLRLGVIRLCLKVGKLNIGVSHAILIDRGDHDVAMVTLIMSAKTNDVDPQAWLAEVLANLADTPISRLQQLLAWNWTPGKLNAQAA